MKIKKKSIRGKITRCLILSVLAAVAAVGIFSMALNYKSTIDTVEQMMTQSAVLAAGRVEQELTAYKNVALNTGCISQLAAGTTTLGKKQAIIDQRVAMHGFQRGNIIDPFGISIFDGKDYSDREYVKQAMAGNIYVSEPLVSKITGELTIMVAAPLYSGGSYGSDVSGVVYFVPPETFLNDIVSSIKVSENSRAYMINRSGDTIADITLDTVMTQNIGQEALSDPSLEELARIHEAGRGGIWPVQKRRPSHVCGLRSCGRHRRLERGHHGAPVRLPGRDHRRHLHQYRGDRGVGAGLQRGGVLAGRKHQRSYESLRGPHAASGGGRFGFPGSPGEEQ